MSNVLDTLDELEHGGAQLPIPPSVRTLVADMQKQQAALREKSRDYTPEARTRQEQEIAAAARSKLAAEEQRVIETDTREIDREIGAARAAAKRVLAFDAYETSSDQGKRQARQLDRVERRLDTQLGVAFVSGSSDAAEVLDYAESVLLSEDDFAVRHVVGTAVRRLQALEREAKHSQPNRLDPAPLGATALAAKLTDWKRAHPSAAERVQQLESQKRMRQHAIGRTFDRIRSVCRFDAPGLVQQEAIAAAKAARGAA